jgi:type II secretory pathway component PulC
MRLRSLAPLIVLFALGCRPRSDGGEAPLVGTEPTEIQSEQPSESSSEPARPPGAIYRNELVRATRGGNAPYLLAQLGPEPYAPQGRFEGWIITRVWPGDPELCASGCDLRAGDIILSVNGSKLETPEQLSNLLADLDAIQSIELTGIRDGEFFERSHAILDEPALAN